MNRPFLESCFNLTTLSRNQRQAEAICDLVTSVILGQEVGEVSRKLVGSEALRYIREVCQ